MTQIFLETIGAPLAAFATLFGAPARSPRQPAREAAAPAAPVVVSRPASGAAASASEAPFNSACNPDYGYSSGCMIGAMGALRGF
jgi:hypothetical protein